MQRKAKGFTVIELLIVVAIISVFAALAIPNYLVYREKVRVRENCQSNG